MVSTALEFGALDRSDTLDNVFSAQTKHQQRRVRVINNFVFFFRLEKNGNYS